MASTAVPSRPPSPRRLNFDRSGAGPPLMHPQPMRIPGAVPYRPRLTPPPPGQPASRGSGAPATGVSRRPSITLSISPPIPAPRRRIEPSPPRGIFGQLPATPPAPRRSIIQPRAPSPAAPRPPAAPPSPSGLRRASSDPLRPRAPPSPRPTPIARPPSLQGSSLPPRRPPSPSSRPSAPTPPAPRPPAVGLLLRRGSTSGPRPSTIRGPSPTRSLPTPQPNYPGDHPPFRTTAYDSQGHAQFTHRALPGTGLTRVETGRYPLTFMNEAIQLCRSLQEAVQSHMKMQFAMATVTPTGDLEPSTGSMNRHVQLFLPLLCGCLNYLTFSKEAVQRAFNVLAGKVKLASTSIKDLLVPIDHYFKRYVDRAEWDPECRAAMPDGMLDLYSWINTCKVYSTLLVQAWKDELSEEYTMTLRRTWAAKPDGKEKSWLRLRFEAWKIAIGDIDQLAWGLSQVTAVFLRNVRALRGISPIEYDRYWSLLRDVLPPIDDLPRPEPSLLPLPARRRPSPDK
ncbi:hypothetical protein BCR35DRAFT_353372, partial [Leucosporidium creatinivorum]